MGAINSEKKTNEMEDDSHKRRVSIRFSSLQNDSIEFFFWHAEGNVTDYFKTNRQRNE